MLSTIPVSNLVCRLKEFLHVQFVLCWEIRLRIYNVSTLHCNLHNTHYRKDSSVTHALQELACLSLEDRRKETKLSLSFKAYIGDVKINVPLNLNSEKLPRDPNKCDKYVPVPPPCFTMVQNNLSSEFIFNKCPTVKWNSLLPLRLVAVNLDVIDIFKNYIHLKSCYKAPA